jgi:predicted phosphodiesterase
MGGHARCARDSRHRTPFNCIARYTTGGRGVDPGDVVGGEGLAQPWWRRAARALWRRWTRVADVVGVVAFATLVVGVFLGPLSSTAGPLGPGRVSLSARVHAGGGTQLQLPPLGTVYAKTHRTPTALDVRVDELDVDRLQRLAEKDRPGTILRDDVEHGLRRLLPRFIIRTLLLALVAGGLAGALVPRRRVRHLIAGGVSGLVCAALLLAPTLETYRVDAFENPRFDGSLTRVPAIFAAVRDGVAELSQVRGRIAALSDQVAALYARSTGGGTTTAAATEGETRILHISDIHSNPVGLEVARQLAEGFKVDAVLDTGDLTSFGLPIEAQLADLVHTFPVPYLFVPGNHDSQANRAAIAAVTPVRLLDGIVVPIGSVRILGVADPTFTATNEETTSQAASTKLEHSFAVASEVLREKPSILAVHDPLLAAHAYGHVPLVVAGHLHKRVMQVHEGTRELVVGSTGATGLGSFTVKRTLSYDAEVLHFDASGRLTAVDDVAMQGVGGSISINRRLISQATGSTG